MYELKYKILDDDIDNRVLVRNFVKQINVKQHLDFTKGAERSFVIPKFCFG